MTKHIPDGGVPQVSQGIDPSSGLQEETVAEPVELLVQLAEEGEIDPWNIDIVQVTDAYLSRLDQGDLRSSGRALFYASVLLRMKSEVLIEVQEDLEPDEPEFEPLMSESPPVMGGDPMGALDEELDRRLARKRARGTPQTLDELVRELRDVERNSWWKSSRTYDTSESPRGFRRGPQTLSYHESDAGRFADEPTEADVTNTTHREDIEAAIERVNERLVEEFDAGREEVLFAEIESAGGSRVTTFLCVLFLAHRRVVRLQQDELFTDLWIQSIE